MNLYYNIICLVTILSFQLNVQAPKSSRKYNVKSDKGVVSIESLKEELFEASPSFKSFKTKVKRLKSKYQNKFDNISAKIPWKNDLGNYIEDLLFIVKLARFIREAEKEGQTEIVINNVVDVLLCFPRLYEVFIKMKKETIPKKMGKESSRKGSVRPRKSASVSHRFRESSESDEAPKMKNRKKNKRGRTPKHKDEISDSKEDNRKNTKKKSKSKRRTSTSDDDSPEETTSKKSSRKGKRAPAKKESSDSSEPEVPRKNSEKKRHNHKSSSDKTSKKKHRESVVADFPSDSNESGDKSKPGAPPSPVALPPIFQHSSKKQSTSHKKSSTAGDSQDRAAGNHKKVDGSESSKTTDAVFEVPDDNYLVSPELYEVMDRYISSNTESMPENDLIRIHLQNGLKFLTHFKNLNKNIGTLKKDDVQKICNEIETDIGAEREQLTAFARSGLAESSNALIDKETRVIIEKDISDDLIPHMNPEDHPVTKHFSNIGQLFDVYRLVEEENGKHDNQKLREEYNKMDHALKAEWKGMFQLLKSFYQAAAENNASA